MQAKDLRSVYAANVRAERARRGWFQAELAEAVGMPRSTLGAVEGGRRRLFVEEAIAIADALGIDLADLFRDSTPETGDYQRYLQPDLMITTEDGKVLVVEAKQVHRRRTGWSSPRPD